MTTFKELAEAWIASREHCSGSIGRICFWVDEFGPLPVESISEDQVDQAISRWWPEVSSKVGPVRTADNPRGNHYPALQ